MRVSNLKIENFRGVRAGFIRFGKHPVFVGDNNTGKTTLIEALTLLLGRDRLVRELTEHDFYGSCPQPADRIKLMVTIVGADRNLTHWGCGRILGLVKQRAPSSCGARRGCGSRVSS